MREVLWLIEFESFKKSAKFKKDDLLRNLSKRLGRSASKKSFFGLNGTSSAKQARRGCQKSKVFKIDQHTCDYCM